MSYADQSYWAGRFDMMYYKYIEVMLRCVAPQAESLVDIGSGNSPYLEWFDWIPERVSFDIRTPYQSATVKGIQGNIYKHDFKRKFDVCTCLQVLEHVEDPTSFVERLWSCSDLLMISVPYKWPEGKTKGHLHDPVDLELLTSWFGRKPNYQLVVSEPFLGQKGRRLIAIFDADQSKVFASAVWRGRRVIEAAPKPALQIPDNDVDRDDEE